MLLIEIWAPEKYKASVSNEFTCSLDVKLLKCTSLEQLLAGEGGH